MFRKLLIPLLTAVFLSGSALAQKVTTPTKKSSNLNSSKSKVSTAPKTPTTDSSNLNLSKSNVNIYRKIKPSDQNAINACTSGGGSVGKDRKGQDACITPEGATKAAAPTAPTPP